MGFRPALAEDAAKIDGFLSTYAETSMYAREYLRSFGPCGGPEPRATTFYLWEENGELTGVAGLSTMGLVMVQLPDAVAHAWTEFRCVLSGKEIKVIYGEANQIISLREALDLNGPGTPPSNPTPTYSLDLGAWSYDTDGAGELRHLTEADHDFLVEWRTAYNRETMGANQADAMQIAREDVPKWISTASHRLYETEEGPVCVTGFNAIFPEVVQVGGVYTPQEHRGHGHAKIAVALHLKEARANGAHRSVLGSAHPSANRVYEALGFKRVGSETLVFFNDPQRVPD